ncbi:MAG: hypothetical protein WBC44_04870 [Planctomycetaceae bacterium]
MDPAKAKGFKAAAATSAVPPTKPAAKPPSRSAAAGKTKPAATRPDRPLAKPSPPENDDPFATDASATAGAIAMSRKPTAQRPHKIICPMCDTPGYAPTAASGKDVRCANANCMVPVFTAPDFAAPKPVETEPQSSGFGPMALTATVVGILLLGGAAWWFFLRAPDGPPIGPVVQPVTPPPDTPPGTTVDVPPAQTDPTDSNQPTPPAPAETLAAAVKHWPRITEDITQPQRQNLLRRYGAEAYALVGNIESAREQISKLLESRSGDPFYAITPLEEVAWSELRGGDEAAARAAFEETVSLTERIPQQGFDPARVVIDWSTAAARFGDEKAARELARAPRDDATGEQLLTMLHSANLFNGGNLNAEYALRPAWRWNQPKPAAVTFGLLNRGAFDQAKTWAMRASDTLTRAEGLAAWGEATAIDEDRAVDERMTAITEALASSQPAERVLVLSRAAIRLAASDQKPAAERLFALMAEGSDQLAASEPFVVATIEEVNQRELPVFAEVRLKAAALGEAAHAASILGKSEEAGRYILQAMEQLRSAAPTTSAVAERRKEFESQQNGLDDSTRNAYRRKLDQMQSAAESRFDLQVELLARSFHWKLGPQVLAEAEIRHESNDPNEKEPYLAGKAGGQLLAAALIAEDEATAQAIRTAGVKNSDVPGPEALELNIRPMLTGGKFEPVAREFGSNAGGVGRSEKLALAIRTACGIPKQRSIADAYAFAMALRDDFVREEVLRYLSRSAAQAGHAAEIEAKLPTLSQIPSDKAAILRGLTEGLVAIGAANQTPQAGSTVSDSGQG